MINRIYNKIFRNAGGTFYCPVCNRKVRQFIPLPEFYRERAEKYGYLYSFDDAETLNYSAYSCPHCTASDRDRLYALYVAKRLMEDGATNIAMLEIAPSRPLSEMLRKTEHVTLRTADLMMDGVDDHVDITDMNCYANAVFDAFICSHVLEHVQDDLKALRELFRILKPGGWGILMVPIILTLDQIDEDPLVEEVGQRWRRFGQDDHVRMYSRNGLIARTEDAGFIVRQFGQEYFAADVFKKHGISDKSILYVVEKK
jgi:predicted SAM-dependent methyltransferase